MKDQKRALRLDLPHPSITTHTTCKASHGKPPKQPPPHNSATYRANALASDPSTKRASRPARRRQNHGTPILTHFSPCLNMAWNSHPGADDPFRRWKPKRSASQGSGSCHPRLHAYAGRSARISVGASAAVRGWFACSRVVWSHSRPSTIAYRSPAFSPIESYFSTSRTTPSTPFLLTLRFSQPSLE